MMPALRESGIVVSAAHLTAKVAETHEYQAIPPPSIAKKSDNDLR